MSDMNNILKWLRLLDADPPEIFWGCVFAITASTCQFWEHGRVGLQDEVGGKNDPGLGSFQEQRWHCPPWRYLPRDATHHRGASHTLSQIHATQTLRQVRASTLLASDIAVETTLHYQRYQCVTKSNIHSLFLKKKKPPSKNPLKKPLQKTRNQSPIDSPLRNCIHLPQRNHAPVLLPLLLETRI